MLVRAEIVARRSAVLDEMEAMLASRSPDLNFLRKKKAEVERMNIQLETLKELEIETEKRTESKPLLVPLYARRSDAKEERTMENREVQIRAITGGTAGSALFQNDRGPLVNPIREALALDKAGARIINSDNYVIEIPTIAKTTATALTENAEATVNAASTSQQDITLERYANWIGISDTLLSAADVEFESGLLQDMGQAIAEQFESDIFADADVAQGATSIVADIDAYYTTNSGAWNGITPTAGRFALDISGGLTDLYQVMLYMVAEGYRIPAAILSAQDYAQVMSTQLTSHGSARWDAESVPVGLAGMKFLPSAGLAQGTALIGDFSKVYVGNGAGSTIGARFLSEEQPKTNSHDIGVQAFLGAAVADFGAVKIFTLTVS